MRNSHSDDCHARRWCLRSLWVDTLTHTLYMLQRPHAVFQADLCVHDLTSSIIAYVIYLRALYIIFHGSDFADTQ